MTRSGITLTHGDLHSLEGSNWVEFNVIQAFLYCFESPQFTVWRDADWRIMRRGDFPEEVVLRTDWRTVRHIYIPLGQPNHFVAVVINVKDRSIFYIDTISGSRSQQSEHAAI